MADGNDGAEKQPLVSDKKVRGWKDFVPIEWDIVQWDTAFEDGYVTSYRTESLSTLAGVFMYKGTVLQDAGLRKNMSVILAIMASISIPFAVSNHDRFNQWVVDTEKKSRDFVAALQTLMAFLLSFYAALSLGRWWAIRGGMSAVGTAAREIALLLTTFATRDSSVISAIDRYASTSLMLIFLDHADIPDKWSSLKSFCELTDEEVQLVQEMAELKTDPSFGCWGWITEIVSQLYHKKVIRNEFHCESLMTRCSNGAKGIQTIKTTLAQQIPLNYVHLLCCLVKTHNLFMAMFMSFIIAHEYNVGEYTLCTMAFLRAFITTFFYNSILAIGAQLADPFSGDPCDFDVPKFAHGIPKTSQTINKAWDLLPAAEFASAVAVEP